MHVTNTPPRKIKAQLRLLFVMLMLFIGTLAICGIFFAFSLSHFPLISPLTTFQDAANQDASIATVKMLCQQNHLSCQLVQEKEDNTIQITLDTGIVVFLSTRKDFKTQLASLQQALSQLTIKGKQFKKLDFRFANTVVSF